MGSNPIGGIQSISGRTTFERDDAGPHQLARQDDHDRVTAALHAHVYDVLRG